MGANSPYQRGWIVGTGVSCLATLALLNGAARAEGDAPDLTSPEFFEQKIKPLLSETCYECHSEKKQESGLRLDSYAAFARGTDTGPIVVPGEPDSSRMVAAIRYAGEIKMPPDMKLFPEEIDLLTEWIRAGAHWPHDPSEEAAPPAPEKVYDADGRMAEAKRTHWAFQPAKMPEVPAVSNPAWPRNEVDRFILAKLDEKGLAPSPEADRRTLIRRLYYDLIGLPPAPAEAEAFVRDDRPEAYGELVETLLAKPQYGERWARHWLDVARYSDTKGYVFNQDRFFAFSYTYRDYVVRAFNEDLPYDRFVVQQLAADQLDLGEDKRPLAAMGFLTLGRRFLEVKNDIVDDRIDVVARGLLGLTVTCARCHDHKFDPIPSADYYSLYGVFRSSEEPAELPLIREPDQADPQYQDYLNVLQTKEDDADDYLSEVHSGLIQHAHDRVGEYLLGAKAAAGIEDKEAFLRIAKERGIIHQLLQRWVDFFKTDRAADPVFGLWCALAKLPDETFAADAPNAPAALTASGAAITPRIAEAFKSPPATLAEAADRYRALFAEVDEKWIRFVAERVQAAVETGTAPRLPTALSDANDEVLRQTLYADGYPATAKLADAFEFSEVPVRERITAMRNVVQNHKATHRGRPDRAMVLTDAEKPFDPYVFLRGKEDSKGEAVPRRFLGVLSCDERAPFAEGSGRLELARAIASPDNPLTARVFVNRVWAHHFGKPLVATPSDFGLRSDPPTHPQLLDYLARRFMDEGWSIKNLHRMIVLSAAYRQASIDRADAIAADPENRLLWKQNRRRLDFESMRDTLLAMASALDFAQGGPAVDMFNPPFTSRRTLYGLVERQNLPSVFRSFDFATPDAHAPLRHETVVPQQALFLMNSPFTIEQARTFAARQELNDCADSGARAALMFRLAYQRDPSPEETALAHDFLARAFDNGPEPPPPLPWHYGYGGVDRITGRVHEFTPFGLFIDGQWRASAAMPDPKLGWVSIGSHGGHPGRTPETAAIRRWVAPFDGAVRISSRLRHSDEHGDGVTGLTVSSRHGILGRWTVHNGAVDMTHEQVSVSAGDSIDFVTECGPTDGYDTFEWAQRVRYVETPNDPDPYRADWEARTDFAGPPAPPPPPLAPLEQLAQVLLLSNELMYVD